MPCQETDWAYSITTVPGTHTCLLYVPNTVMITMSDMLSVLNQNFNYTVSPIQSMKLDRP